MDSLTDKDLWLIDSRFCTIRDRVRDLLSPRGSNDLASFFVRISIDSVLRQKSLFELWHPDWHADAVEFAELADVLLAAKQL